MFLFSAISRRRKKWSVHKKFGNLVSCTPLFKGRAQSFRSKVDKQSGWSTRKVLSSFFIKQTMQLWWPGGPILSRAIEPARHNKVDIHYVTWMPGEVSSMLRVRNKRSFTYTKELYLLLFESMSFKSEFYCLLYSAVDFRITKIKEVFTIGRKVSIVVE